MNISKNDLEQAVSEGVLSESQATLLWERLARKQEDKPRFNGVSVAYYFGALIVISAMTWFMTAAWESFGGWGIFLIALVYGVTFALMGRYLWFKQKLSVPGGLLFTLAVCMTPLVVYGFQRATGLWPQGDPGNYENYYVWVKGSWLPIELGTVAAALITLKFVRFPFLLAPIAFTLWYMSMDLTPLLFGKTEYSWDERLWVSLIFGALMLLGAYLIDHKTSRDYAFWLYLFGAFAFWTGLGLLTNGNALQEFFFLLVNLVFMVLSVLLQRRLLVVFGSIGVFAYLSQLAYDTFAGSILFPFVLSAIGLSIIFLGVAYQRNRARLEATLLNTLPGGLKRLLPVHRRDRE